MSSAHLTKTAATDLGNAERLARRAAGRFLYVPPWKTWLVSEDGKWWVRDEADTIRVLAVEVVKSMLVEARNESTDSKRMSLIEHALRSQAASRIAAMIKLAPSVRAELCATPSAFEKDEYPGHVTRWWLKSAGPRTTMVFLPPYAKPKRARKR